MTRRYSANETMRKAKSKRELALARNEFRYPSEPRTAPDSATSFPIKAEDPALRRLIDEAIARRATT